MRPITTLRVCLEQIIHPLTPKYQHDSIKNTNSGFPPLIKEEYEKNANIL
jgi:hypothetical protein